MRWKCETFVQCTISDVSAVANLHSSFKFCCYKLRTIGAARVKLVRKGGSTVRVYIIQHLQTWRWCDVEFSVVFNKCVVGADAADVVVILLLLLLLLLLLVLCHCSCLLSHAICSCHFFWTNSGSNRWGFKFQTAILSVLCVMFQV